MTARWFRPVAFYRHDGDKCVFYPSLYSPGYRFSAEDRAAMDGVLGPFLTGRLWIEFLVVFCSVTFALTIGAGGYLVVASAEELDALLATPPWVWLLAAFVFAGLMLVPLMVRLRMKIGQQLREMGVDLDEPPRPDFVVDGAFSWRRLACVFLGMGGILALAGFVDPALATPMALHLIAFAVVFALLVVDHFKS